VAELLLGVPGHGQRLAVDPVENERLRELQEQVSPLRRAQPQIHVLGLDELGAVAADREHGLAVHEC